MTIKDNTGIVVGTEFLYLDRINVNILVTILYHRFIWCYHKTTG